MPTVCNIIKFYYKHWNVKKKNKSQGMHEKTEPNVTKGQFPIQNYRQIFVIQSEKSNSGMWNMPLFII